MAERAPRQLGESLYRASRWRPCLQACPGASGYPQRACTSQSAQGRREVLTSYRSLPKVHPGQWWETSNRPCYSKCPLPSICLTWGLVGNIRSLSPPRPTKPESALARFQGPWIACRFEKPCSQAPEGLLAETPLLAILVPS